MIQDINQRFDKIQLMAKNKNTLISAIIDTIVKYSYISEIFCK